MWLLVGTLTITILSIYFLIRLGEDHPFFETFLFVIFFDVFMIPSLILFLVLEHYDVVQEYKVFPITLPLFLMAGIILWATHGKTTNSNGDTDEKKDDFTAEAIIMTTILSETEKDSSSKSDNSNSSSSDDKDDFFFL